MWLYYSYMKQSDQYIFVAGVCLVLDEKGIDLESYNCTNFTNGCPDSFYFMNNVYKCKIQV